MNCFVPRLNMKNLMNKLSFNKKKQNTQGVQFRIDPKTNQNLTVLRNYYSAETGRKITTGEICKKLINQHIENLKLQRIEKDVL